MNNNYPIAEIAADVCVQFKITIEQLCGKSQKRDYSYPRHIFCYICRMHTGYTLREIGIFLGNRDHTTVMHSTQTVKEFFKTKDSLFLNEWWDVYTSNSALLNQLKK